MSFSLGENVAAAVEYDTGRVLDCLGKAGFSERLNTLPKGLETMLNKDFDESGVQVSGGEAQKIALARALYKDAPMLVLDEPTAALDPIAENDIYLKYNEMTKGRTSLYISHRLASTQFCDRILFLADGNIAEEGTHQTLLAIGGGYAKLFEVQSKYYKEGVNENE